MSALSSLLGSKNIHKNRQGAVFFNCRCHFGISSSSVNRRINILNHHGNPICKVSLRLPFELSSIPETYQQTMVELFGNLSGVEICVDDFFVWGETQEEHNSGLKSLFERCFAVIFKLNKDKCKFLLPEIKYICHVIDSQTRKLHPEKVKAIVSFKQPGNKQYVFSDSSKWSSILLGFATPCQKRWLLCGCPQPYSKLLRIP